MRPPLDMDPQALVAAAPVPWGVVVDGVIVLANDELATVMLGPDSSVEGRRLVDLLHLEDRGVVRSLLVEGGRWRQPARTAPRRGGVAQVLLSCAPLDDAEDACLVVATDVTEQQRTADELRRLRDDAVVLAERRQGFVATVTHELRSPLHAILGLGELLLAGTDGENPHALLARLVGEAERLQRTVDDLLELVRTDSDEVRLETADVDVRAMLDRVARRVQTATGRAEVTLSTVVADDVPDRIGSDAYRLDQILTNLVGNALAYTAAGTVEVTASAHGDDQLQITVADSGPGIPEGYREEVFEPFVRVPGSAAGGTGLGLPLVRTLSRALGGDVTLECPDGGGSVFTVLLPLSAVVATEDAAAGPPVPLVSTPAAGAEVLVVEDTEMIQLLAHRQLDRLGHRATIVSTGEEALALLGADPDRFAVVLMDWQLPDGNGATFTRRIRQQERDEDRRRLVVIAITANAMPDTREACMAAGMDDFLAKPVSLQELRRALDRWLAVDVPADPRARLVDTDRLLALAIDPDRPDPLLQAARGHLARLEQDLTDLDRLPPVGDRRRYLLPHHRVMVTLGLDRLAAGLDALADDRASLAEVQRDAAETLVALRHLTTSGER